MAHIPRMMMPMSIRMQPHLGRRVFNQTMHSKHARARRWRQDVADVELLRVVNPGDLLGSCCLLRVLVNRDGHVLEAGGDVLLREGVCVFLEQVA